MAALALDVRLDGFADPVGVLARDDNEALTFAYREDYLAGDRPVPLSLSLPLSTEAYGDRQTRPFFDNLLQERDGALADIMAREGLARDDVAGLLYHLGRDCAGALSVLPAGSPPVKVPGKYETDYRPIPDDRMNEIVQALHQRRGLPAGTQDPSPLAGLQSKIALTVLPDGSLAEPIPGSGAPTTHILKVPDENHRGDAALEQSALRLSRALGFDTADAAVVEIAGIAALLLTRYDRDLDAAGRIVRIHQEDFAQALGLPSRLKYERYGQEGRRFDAAAAGWVLDQTVDPIGARETFVRATLFDMLVGNRDGHAKNFALVFDRAGGARLAPRYDILPTRLDPALTDELPFRIGAAETFETIAASDLDAFLEALGLGGRAARRRLLRRHGGDIASGLAAQLDVLQQEGMKRFADLIAANIRRLAEILDMDVPEAARDRDAFVAKGGGWILGS